MSKALFAKLSLNFRDERSSMWARPLFPSAYLEEFAKVFLFGLEPLWNWGVVFLGIVRNEDISRKSNKFTKENGCNSQVNIFDAFEHLPNRNSGSRRFPIGGQKLLSPQLWWRTEILNSLFRLWFSFWKQSRGDHNRWVLRRFSFKI